jgi:hypothetical protein
MTVEICGYANLIFVDGRHSGYAIDQRPEGTRLRRAVDLASPLPILSLLLPRPRYALSRHDEYDELVSTLAFYFERGHLFKYSGPWYVAMVEAGTLTFADVMGLTGLTAAEVADMVYDVMGTEVTR